MESSRQKYCFTKMEKKNKKQEQEAKAWKKVARNHEILGMLKASVSANQIAKDFSLSYAGAKKICAKLKSSGDFVIARLARVESVNKRRN